jgi:hypothetical protein
MTRGLIGKKIKQSPLKEYAIAPDIVEYEWITIPMQ